MPQEPSSQPKNHEGIQSECEAIEAELAALKVAYEQYFLGAERQPPLRAHEALKKRVAKVQTGFVRNTALKFRVQGLQSKFLTYERLWQRTLQEIEAGTYKRDLAKARRRAAKLAQAPQPSAGASTARGPVVLEEDSDFDVDQALAALEAPEPPLPQPLPAAARAPAAPAAVAPAAGLRAPVAPPAAPQPPRAAAPLVPGALLPPRAVTPLPQAAAASPPPARAVPLAAPLAGAAAPRPAAAAARPAGAPAAAPRPPAAGADGIAEDKLRAVYDAYVTAKRRCQEDTSKLSFESVAGTLRRQVPELMRQHNAKAVEFKVVIKDGKAVLKAVPK